MTQREVAEAARLDAKFYWAIETGRRNVTVATIERIARVLRVEPWELLRPLTRREAKAPRDLDRYVALLERLEPDDRRALLGVLERFGAYDARRARR